MPDADREIEKRLGKVENRVTGLETEMPYLKETIDRNTKATDKLNDTLQALKETLVNITSKQKEQDDKLDGEEKKIKEIDERIRAVRAEVEKIDDKGKFDIMLAIQKYFPWLIVVALAGIIAVKKLLGA